jgi:hypothetical protein
LNLSRVYIYPKKNDDIDNQTKSWCNICAIKIKEKKLSDNFIFENINVSML